MTGVLDEVAKDICDRYLTPYVQRLENAQSIGAQAKQVHDAVWGTVSLRPLEVVILDSPLLQRLRHLRQLGVAHWVYPGADHSRFEHSLGVLHQVQQLISAINRAGATKYGEIVINDDDTQMLRIAALMHDIGHPVLSHVSEYALRLEGKMLLEIQRERKKYGEKVSISELVAAKVVLSDAFRELLQAVAKDNGNAGGNATAWKSNPQAFTERVANTILGRIVSTRVPLLHELVSGPYDADKLDYMVRDPKTAGIPAIIDMSRLVQKLTVERRTETQLPSAIARHVPQGTGDVFMFGFPWSGVSVIDELLLGRMMLYSKLYRHPKVAALEAMVKLLIDQLYVLVGYKKVVGFIYDVLDDQLVLANPPTLLTQLGLSEDDVAEDDKKQAFEVAVDLLRRLRERELFVRSFAFLPGQPVSEGDAQSERFDQLIKTLDNAGNAKELHGKIVRKTRDILKALKEPEDSFRFRNADQLIAIRRLESPSQKELRHAWIFPTGGEPRTFNEIGIHKEAWSSSFVSASAKGYIMAPKDLAKEVLLATETVVAEEYYINVPEWMLEETKQSPRTLRDLKLQLREAGFYRDKPRIIRPRQNRLMMTDVEKGINAFVERFAVVQETVAEVHELLDEDLTPISLKERTYSWLDQFGGDDEIDCALELLKHARLVERSDVVDAVKTFIAENENFTSASVISLNSGNDSSQIVQYYAADAGKDLRFFGSPDELEREGREDPVIIIDDFCGTGNQWSNTIGSLFGVAEEERSDLNEQRPLALQPVQDFLRKREIAFIFVGGWEDGREAIQKAASAAKIDAKVHINLTEDQLPFAGSILREGPHAEHADAFLEKAGEIGEALLRSQEDGWDEGKFASRKLGYGNRAMLLFFPYNAPSQTLTCMWSDGQYDGESWNPLIRRRKKNTGAAKKTG